MGHPDGAHTHGSSTGPGGLVLIILGAVIVAAIAGPVAAAVAELLRLVLIAAAVILGLGLAAVGALVAFRLRQGRANAPQARVIAARTCPQPVQGRTAPRELGQPGGVHLHFHGVTAEDVAAIRKVASRIKGTVSYGFPVTAAQWEVLDFAQRRQHDPQKAGDFPRQGDPPPAESDPQGTGGTT